MKKLLLAGTALVGMAVLSAPAHAELKTELGGFFRGYGVFVDNDEVSANAAGDSLHQFEFRRDNEIHFNGEVTLDNGLTVGAHTEVSLSGSTVNNDETYAYFSGGWGRVNFGAEDGAAFLLQVAAPSADSNVDGLRPYISGLNTNVWNDHLVAGAANRPFLLGALTSYQHADFVRVDRLTYLTPKIGGFQVGLSYAPIATRVAGIQAASADNDVNDFDNLLEAAARWDGDFSAVGVSVGAGYSFASAENEAASGVGGFGSDDLETFNVGANVTWSGFSLGGGYKFTNNGVDAGAVDADTQTFVVGLGWDNGPYHLGASYLNGEADAGARVLTNQDAEVEFEQFTFGGGYTYGPGMTFRGTYMFGTVDNKLAAGTVSTDFQQATLGTDIQF